MGDGGVACASLQHLMERFPVPEALCGANGKFSFKSEKKMMREDKEQEKDEREKNKDSEKGDSLHGRRQREDERELLRRKELKKGEHRKEELEKGEFVPDGPSREELEKGEFVLQNCEKDEFLKGGLLPDKWRKREVENGELGAEKGKKGDLEFLPYKCRKGDRERSPENHRRKGSGRYENDNQKRGFSKRDGSSREKELKNSSRSADEEPGMSKHEHHNGKTHDKDHNSGVLPRRHFSETDSNSSRKHTGEFKDHSVSKSRRISEDGNKCSYSERSGRSHSSSASRAASTSRSFSAKNHESSLPSRGGHESQILSPGYSEKSPHERSRHHDHPEHSPHDRSKYRDRRDRNSSRSDLSPYERSRKHDHHEHSRKGSGSERHPGYRYEERSSRTESAGKNARKVNTSKQSSACIEKVSDDKSNKDKELQTSSMEPGELPPPPPPPPLPPPPPPPPLSHVSGFIEEQSMMEEDMDICDTPPHSDFLADLNLGKWFYLDHFGMEQGPSRLADLKSLVQDGALLSDHLIKHSDSDRWVTVENAASPMAPSDFVNVFPDTVTVMVNPPEVSGNALSDFGDLYISSVQELQHEDASMDLLLEDHMIDERVEALLAGYNVVGGTELESLAEALCTSFTHAEWENWSHSEGFTRSRTCAFDLNTHSKAEDMHLSSEGNIKETTESRLALAPEEFAVVDSHSWFSGRWSCKGGDWKRNDEAAQNGSYKKKLVLNDGYALCQMEKNGSQDPRLQRNDDLYNASRIKKLDLPVWAFTWAEDKNDTGSDPGMTAAGGRAGHAKPLVPRAVKGSILPVIRINACVIRDQGSVESRSRQKGNERNTSKSSRSYTSNNHRESCSEGSSHSRKLHDHDFQSMHECRKILNAPRDHVCTFDELSVHLGDWYYLDGAGHEHGPSSYSELQNLVARGLLLKDCSVFRKDDNTWLPIISKSISFSTAHSNQESRIQIIDTIDTSPKRSQLHLCHSDASSTCNSFHGSHPQFIGYMRGKLHELVMKSYKNREFASAINEVLDPWLSAKQPKKVVDKHFSFNSSITRSSAVLAHDLSGDKFWKSDSITGVHRDIAHLGKRTWTFLDGTEFENVDYDSVAVMQADCAFEDLCSEAASMEDNFSNIMGENENWGFLNRHILARVFHFLRTDINLLVFSAATCKHWKEAVNFYRSISKCIDFSSFGPRCTDFMFRSVMSGFNQKNVTSLVLLGCHSISENALEEVLGSFPCISSIDIRGCNQFMDLISKYQFVKWMHNSGSRKNEEQSKSRSLKFIAEKYHSMSKSFKGSASFLDDFREINHETSKDQNSLSQPFCQGYYKRMRLGDARKSSAVLSRDARMMQLLRNKSENAFKKMKDYISSNLKDIMKGNTVEFFLPKVSEIEDRIRSGYYSRRGLDYIKDDIRRMCRDALKARRRGESEVKQTVMLFNQLVKSLDGKSKSSSDMIRMLKDDSDDELFLSSSRNGKKQTRTVCDKRAVRKSNDSLHANGGGKREVDSSSEASDEHDVSFHGDGKFDVGSTDSDTESDLDVCPRWKRNIKGDGFGLMDDVLDSVNDDREWGARMTKAGLVPPVTRKYEVIDKYLIVADDEEVRRKMEVALPEDYAEKLLAQRKSSADMELPEVKQYKPRKVLGEEVLEQEVYGIDPYTHNLLLDSLPDDSDWPLVEKHKFIEEVLLCVLNKQTRYFTGVGNTPMIYPLQPVVEDIQRTAEDGGDTHVVKMCQFLLKTMQSRPEDNYVSYRKGLGVVCNKEEGFTMDDFVVEFFGEVYPTWKWFEKQDGIRSLQKDNQDAPEFYNIYLERPKGDRDGYDLLVVDAMHKANYASRICHSCRPNCQTKVTAVDGLYQIGVYAIRPISYGEEITFDYNSVTESKEEYEASVCLCGSHVCKGSYLNLTGEGAFQMVLKESHGLLHRHKLLLAACEANYVSQEDYIDLGRAGLGTCLLSGLPNWLVAYAAHLVRFINFERTKLPEEILKHILDEKKKFFSDICLETEKEDAQNQADGVCNARIQNMALTLDKVRYVMRSVFGDPRMAPPPLEKLSPESLISFLWKGEGSLVEDLLHCMAPHMEADVLNDLKLKIQAHDPSGSEDPRKELKKCLLWLRDELRDLPCTYKCRHDAAADLIHMYAYTKFFFKVQDYRAVQSPPVYISPLDLGPKYADKMGSGFQEYCKSYGESYCIGQLIYWHSQSRADPDCSLARARRGCLSLPDVSSFYAKPHKPLREYVYGSRTLRFMLSRMERQPERPWPKDRIWTFKSNPRIFGSPMMDAVLNDSPLDKEMMHWLKGRPNIFQGSWDG